MLQGRIPRAATLVALAVTTIAGARTAGAVELSLHEALERVAESSHDVRRARAERLAVEARLVGASLVLPSNPVISGSVGVLHVSKQIAGALTLPGGQGPQWGARLEQAVEVGGQRGAR